MAEVIVNAAGGYRFIHGVFQYSGGIAPLLGFSLARVQFRRPLPLSEGFAAAARWLNEQGRPLSAFAACELRSPAPFDEAGFLAFNQNYVGHIEGWKLHVDGVNPVGRTNVCSIAFPVASPSMHAFTCTIPSARPGPAEFVVSGSAEVPEGMANYADHIVSPGDISRDGMWEKACWVLGEMERRMQALGASWSDSSHTSLYCAHDIGTLVADEIAPRGAMRNGLTWHFASPPVAGLDFEMDVRSVGQDHVI